MTKLKKKIEYVRLDIWTQEPKENPPRASTATPWKRASNGMISEISPKDLEELFKRGSSLIEDLINNNEDN